MISSKLSQKLSELSNHMISLQYELQSEIGWYAEKSVREVNVKLCSMVMDLMKSSVLICISKEHHLNNNLNTNVEDC